MNNAGLIDAHVHLWRVDRGDYSWMTPDLPIYRNYGLDDLRPLLGGARAVLVQAADTEAETHYLLDLMHKSDGMIAGVVGWADLAAPDAAERVAALAVAPGLVGLRPMLQDIDDTNWILRPDVAMGLEAMARHGLRLDVLARVRHLPVLPKLAQLHPDLAMVVDHAAKPDIAGGDLGTWRRDIAAVARQTAAFCKVSGLATEAAAGWTVATLRPVVEHLLAEFGPARLIWGSDWPVLTLNGTYANWWAATLELVEPAARAAILGENARAFYGLAHPMPE